MLAGAGGIFFLGPIFQVSFLNEGLNVLKSGWKTGQTDIVHHRMRKMK